MTPSLAHCPYPGLRRFDHANAHLYFGRERESAAVAARLASSRFLAVTGESGCGKSSLILSGVARLLRAEPAPVRIAVMQPGNDPFASLARTLAELADPDATGLDREIAESALRSSSRGIQEALRQFRLPTGERILIVVDQFEEIFRFKRRHDEAAEDARAFVRLLLTATAEDGASAFVIITMRSDYLGDCAQFAGLPEAINAGEYLVPRMTREQMRDAIQRPAFAVNTTIAPRLVARILNEVGDDPGELPVLQHALMRTWQAWLADHTAEEPVELRHYELSGTLSHALSQHADEALDALQPAHLRAVAERVFRALTETPPSGRPIRRPTPVGLLARIAGASPEEVEQVLMHFSAPGRGFLRYPGDPGPPDSNDAIVDITHECLITRWQRLRDWVQQEARDAELYRRLAHDAQLHATGERSLWRNPELAVASRWVTERRPTVEWAVQYAPGFEQATRFLEAGQRADQRQRVLRLAVTWGVAAVVLVALAALAWAQWQASEKDRALAETAVARAEVADTNARAAIRERDALQQRVADLTAENPQLSDTAIALRKENRELQWTLLQLQAENRAFEQQISSLRLDISNVEQKLQLAAQKQESISTALTRSGQERNSLRASISTLERDEEAAREEWNRAWEVNNSLRDKALAAGVLTELGFSTASMPAPPPPGPDEAKTQTGQMAGESPRASESAQLQFQLRQLEAENLLLKQSVEELTEVNRRLRTQESEALARNTGLREERNRLEAQRTALNAKLRQAEIAVQAATDKLNAVLEEQRDLALRKEVLSWQVMQTRRSTQQLRRENTLIEQFLSQPR
ncbi:MAG: hypothetical protein KIT83_18080 [Bryobacterales bacterium]|nr:hypothetical protein [Bryobacterales bacterium]